MKRRYPVTKDIESLPIKVPAMEKTSTELQLIDCKRISRNSALSLIELAAEVEKANSYVKNSACTKLKMIVDQMKFLQQQARSVLQEAEQNAFLHNANCNFVKHPGHVYHLYRRSSGEYYLSMISPEEWGTSGPQQQHEGSFRLEQDQSWTPLSKISERDEAYGALESFLSDKGAAKTPQITHMLSN